MTDAWLSVVGGGAVAAIVTIAFSAWWDTRKQKIAEEWEFRRYHANIIHLSTAGLMEAYFASKNELYYLTSTLGALLAALNQLAAQADQIVRQQGGPELTVAALEEKKRQLLQPFQKFNDDQVNARWFQYEQKAKENHTKAEIHLTALKPIIAAPLYKEIVLLFERLSAPFEWNLPGGKEKLKVAEEALPEILALREKLTRELEKKLGR